jgi:hypothetical protein
VRRRRIEGVLTSSDVHEDAAYLPREPGPGVEPYRAEPIRAIAIEWARQARLPGEAEVRAALRAVSPAGTSG